MLESNLRPVALPGHLFGAVAPCDLFNSRGTLLLRSGAPIPARVEPAQNRHRLFCAASHASALSSFDPIGELHALAARLSVLAERIEHGRAVDGQSLIDLARELHEIWLQDADVCMGYLRRVRFARPSVHHAVHAAIFAAEQAAASGMARSGAINLIGAALTMNLGSMILHDEMFVLAGTPDGKTREGIRAHPEKAARILERLGGIPAEWVSAVLESHECIDGTGFPLGLQRAEISLAARMLRVIDTFVARLAGRRHRAPRPWLIHQTRDARRLTQHVFGSDLERLDQSLVRSLISRLGAFPPGTLVRLSNGETALVSRRWSQGTWQPKQVLALISAQGRLLDAARPRRISARELKINSYVDEPQPLLADLDWRTIWGYER